MLPSWRDRYVAVLSPERVAMVRRPWGPRGRFELLAETSCAAPEPSAAVEALAKLLARPGIGKGDLTVVLSNHFVRYLLVPWRAEVGTPSELAAFAEICFDEVYGNAEGARILLTSREKSNSPRLAAALDAMLMNELRAAVAASPLRLVSTQPYLATAFNRLRQRLGRDDFLLAVAEPSRCCLLVSTGGCWRSVRAAASEATPQALAELIEREAQLSGLAEGGMPRIVVHAPGNSGLQVRECHGVRPEAIEVKAPVAGSASTDHLVAMAMAAV